MAALWWSSTRLTLSQALGSIGEYKGVVADQLSELGYMNVRHTEMEVAGEKNGDIVAIAHFYIGDRDFWEVVMGASADAAVARANVEQLVALLANLHFL